MIKKDFSVWLDEKTNIINDSLKTFLKGDSKLYEAMNYSVFAGGKRIRPILLLAGYEMFSGGKSLDKAIPFACALEMIHTYSLIHDDLPAIDNDDLRRNQPTCHKKFGEAIAILAGDGLLNEAFEIMAAECVNGQDIGKNKALLEIARAAGNHGMIGGQTEDVLNENKKIDFETLIYIHKHKTAALFVASLCAGAMLSGASEANLELLRESAENLGIAFQIKDDILDVTGEEALLGKRINHDEKSQKATYVSICGLDKAKEDFEAFSLSALSKLKEIDGDTSYMIKMYEMLIKRNK